jgi:hypothetical protein
MIRPAGGLPVTVAVVQAEVAPDLAHALERTATGVREALAVYDEPRVLVAELELGRIREERMTLDVAGRTCESPSVVRPSVIPPPRVRRSTGAAAWCPTHDR